MFKQFSEIEIGNFFEFYIWGDGYITFKKISKNEGETKSGEIFNFISNDNCKILED